eukprot:TRINITY_DN14191_c0_g1_i5.p1 TRINITY_DN14191_c0_g1~~TRINITY_DN14191_c0_g1_i5.p1  ORF type:complete len:252 (-),score=36.96 TRINITY_DN14191_c0_g1_i5:267-1022(-)
MTNDIVNEGCGTANVGPLHTTDAQIKSYAVDEEIDELLTLRRVSSWHAGYEPLEPRVEFSASTISEMSTAACTPVFGPYVGLAQAMLDHVGDDGGTHEWCQVSTVGTPSTRSSATMSEGAYEPMPDTDDEFDAPIQTTMNYSGWLPTRAGYAPLHCVAPCFVREGLSPNSLSVSMATPVVGETFAATQMQHFEPKTNVSGLLSLTPSTFDEQGCAKDDDESNDFFRSISFSEFLAAYEATQGQSDKSEGCL